MKNGLIVVLVLAFAFLFYQNRTLRGQLEATRSHLNTTQDAVLEVQQQVKEQVKQSAQMAASPTPSATNAAIPQNTPVSSARNRLNELTAERAYLQQQMKEQTPQNLDQLLKQKQSDLTALQNQLKSYQTNGQTGEQNVNTALQFQRTLSQQTQTLLAQRIRNQERVIRNTRREMMMLGQTPDFDLENKVIAYNNLLNQQQADLQNLIAQKDAAANEAVQNTTNLGSQMENAKATLANTQNAIQRQIARVQQDIQSISDQKAQAQATLSGYQQDLKQMDQAIRQQKQLLKSN